MPLITSTRRAGLSAAALLTTALALAPAALAADTVTRTQTVGLNCGWAGDTTLPTGSIRFDVDVTLTTPTAVDRNGSFTLSGVSTTLHLPEGDDQVLAGEHFDHAEVVGNVLRAGNSVFNYGAVAGPLTIPPTGTVRLPAEGSFPTYTVPTSEAAAWNTVEPQLDELKIAVFHTPPRISSRLDCEPSLSHTLAVVPITPAPDSPVITRISNAIAGYGGLVEARGTNLSKVKQVIVGGQRTIFFVFNNRLYLLPRVQGPGVLDVYASAANHDTTHAQLRYVKLF